MTAASDRDWDIDGEDVESDGAPEREAWEEGPPEGFCDDAPPGEAPPGESEAQSSPSPWAERVSPVAPEWLSTPPARREWLLRDSRRPKADGVLPLGKVGELVAEGGIGKSMVNVQLAIAVATGGLWLGTLSVPSAGRSLVILGEEDAEEARRRVYNAVRATGASAEAVAANVVTLPLAGIPCSMIETFNRSPIDGAFLVWLREYALTHGPWKLLIVDPLSRFAGQDAETDNAAATRFVQALESLASATGATVLTSHHPHKPARGDGAIVDTSSSRGSSALTDGVRWVATMGATKTKLDDPEVEARLGEIVTLSFTKSNYGRKADPILLRRDLDNGGALVPLDESDRAFIAAERESSEPRAKRAAGRASDAEAKRARDEGNRARKESQRRDKLAADHLAQDRALVAVLREQPGIGVYDLRAALAAKLGACGKDACADTVARLGAGVRTAHPEGATHNARGHWLDEEHLRADLRREST